MDSEEREHVKTRKNDYKARDSESKISISDRICKLLNINRDVLEVVGFIVLLVIGAIAIIVNNIIFLLVIVLLWFKFMAWVDENYYKQ